MSRWYRAYEGTVTDAKLHEAAMVAGVSRSVAIAVWHALLEACAAAKGDQYDTTPRRIAVILGEPVASIAGVFDALCELGMISDGRVTSWAKRQFEGDTSTERSRRHREAKRNGDATDCNVAATLHGVAETPGGRRATPPYTETDTDTDIPPPPSRARANASDDDETLSAALVDAAGGALSNPAGSPSLISMATPRRWIAEGCDLADDIIPVLKAAAARGGPPGRIRSWEAFSTDVALARDRRLNPPPTRPPPDGVGRYPAKGSSMALIDEMIAAAKAKKTEAG